MIQIPVEPAITEYLHAKASRAHIPLSGTFELTPLCNMSCKMCYVRLTPGQQQAIRPLRTAEEWIALGEEAKKAGLLYLLLTGGEPFLHPQFREILTGLQKMGFVISINTNGTLIDEATVAWLKTAPPTRMNITLYGASNETYGKLCGNPMGFSQVTRAIGLLREAGISVKLNCSLTPYNEGDLEEMVSYAQERNLILDAVTYMFPPVRRDSGSVGRNDRFTPREAAACHMKRYRLQQGEEMYQRFLREAAAGMAAPPGLDESCIDPANGKVRCRAGKAAFWITWDGFMTPCGMMPEPKAELRGRSFREAWEETVGSSKAIRLSSVCETCPDKKMCHSCGAMAYAETGSFSGIPKYLCQMMEAMRTLAREESNHLS